MRKSEWDRLETSSIAVLREQLNQYGHPQHPERVQAALDILRLLNGYEPEPDPEPDPETAEDETTA
jgi:hypothetical protein